MPVKDSKRSLLQSAERLERSLKEVKPEHPETKKHLEERIKHLREMAEKAQDPQGKPPLRKMSFPPRDREKYPNPGDEPIAEACLRQGLRPPEPDEDPISWAQSGPHLNSLSTSSSQNLAGGDDRRPGLEKPQRNDELCLWKLPPTERPYPPDEGPCFPDPPDEGILKSCLVLGFRPPDPGEDMWDWMESQGIEADPRAAATLRPVASQNLANLDRESMETTMSETDAKTQEGRTRVQQKLQEVDETERPGGAESLGPSQPTNGYVPTYTPLTPEALNSVLQRVKEEQKWRGLEF